MTEPDLQGFVGRAPFAPPPPRAPTPGAVVPRPRRHHDEGEVVVPYSGVTVLGAPPGARAVLTAGLARRGVPVRDRDGWPIRFVSEDGAAGEEGYHLTARATGMTVSAATSTGLVRGAATARQLVRRTGDGLTVRAATIDDAPTVPLRMLAGWGLYRSHHLDWAIEIATEGKFNRVLYNWWTATAEERMGRRETELVEAARSIGIELVCELRRQALGPAFSLENPASLEPLLAHYDDAVAHGFRSFGFLFDDTDHDRFEDELGLLRRIVDRITDRLGAEPEFFFCPRFYWFPGQMDYSWMAAAAASSDEPSLTPMLGGAAPRRADAARARQQEYQRLLRAALPARTEVYLANWWSGTPDDWAPQLDEEWTTPLGRRPVFWDNQQQNDFRAAAVLPIPLHQRPATFAEELRGYTLNSGVPMSAFATTSITAGAWAWNPGGYEAAEAWGAAIARLYGPAAPLVTDALAAWSALLDDLLQPRTGTEQHYRGLLLAVRAGRAPEVTAALDRVDALLLEAQTVLPESSHPLAADGLDELREEIGRLRLDLALASCRDAREARRVVDAIAAILASRLPPVPELGPVLAGARPDAAVPGISWAIHFYFGPLAAGPRRLLDKVPPPEVATS